MLKLLRLEDRQPLDSEDTAALDSIARAVASEPTASLADAERYVKESFPSYKVGHGGSHVWISKKVEPAGDQFHSGWHRIGMISEREYLEAKELTATMVRKAGGNEVTVVIRGEVCTVRLVYPWFIVRNTVTDKAIKWTEWALVEAFLTIGVRQGGYDV